TADPLDASELQESLSMAFLLLLERLSPVERAAFLLHEVFGYGYNELVRVLSKSEATCRQIVHRARRHVTENRPRFDAALTPSTPAVFLPRLSWVTRRTAKQRAASDFIKRR